MIMEIDYSLLGQQIRTLRETGPMKVSREALAEYAGVTSTSVYRWENNEGKPELGHILKVCDFFKITLYQLLGEPSRSDLIVDIVKLLPSLDQDQLRSILSAINRSLSDDTPTVAASKRAK